MFQEAIRPNEWFHKKHKGAALNSHKLKKYYSLMLIPSYSSGKTRSIRISNNVLYSACLVILAIGIIISFLYGQASFSRQIAEDFSISLEHTQAAYADLQQTAEQVQSQLTQSVVSLLSDLTDERYRSQEEMLLLQQEYINSLEIIWIYAESLETRLREYEQYRQEIMESLSESAHIPAVSTIINDVQQSQTYLLLTLEELDSFSSYMRFASAEDATISLISYIETLESALEAQSELFVQLKQQVNSAAPLIHRDRYGPELLEWSYVRTLLPRNTPIMITDVRTGITYWVNSFSHGNHADVFPVTPEDTAALHRTFNGQWSWNTRPIWVHVGDRKIAASINGMPHGGGSRSNNMNGHICIHFRGSRTHNGSIAHERDHQNSVTEAYRAFR